MWTLLFQIRLLLWRNWLIKKRHPLSLLSEILLPIGFIFLVVWLQGLDPDIQMNESTYTCPRQASISPTMFIPEDPDSHR